MLTLILSEPDLAEWMWLIGTILLLIAAFLDFDRGRAHPDHNHIRGSYAAAVAYLGLAFVAFGWVAV